MMNNWPAFYFVFNSISEIAAQSWTFITLATTATRAISCLVPGKERRSCGTIILWMKKAVGLEKWTNIVYMVDVTY